MGFLSFKTKLNILAVITLLVVTSIIFKFHKASALTADCSYNTFGRCANESYYGDVPINSVWIDPGNQWIWPLGNDQINRAYNSTPNSSDGFINRVKADLDLNNPFVRIGYNYIITNGGQCDNATPVGPWNIPLCKHMAGIVIGSSYYVNTMLGIDADSVNFGAIDKLNPLANFIPPSRSQKGVDYAIAHLSQWEPLIAYYDSKGWIDYNYTLTYNCKVNCGDANPANDESDPRLDEIVILSGLDVAAYVNTSVNSDQYIRFSNPDGSFYTINKRCGNVTANVKPLVGSHGFDVSATPKVTLNNSEVPTTATFTLTASVDEAPVNQVDFVRFYYIDPKGPGPNIPLSVQPISASVESENVDFPNTSVKTFTPRIATGPAINSLVVGDQVCVTLVIAPKTGNASVIDGTISTPLTPYAYPPACAIVVAEPYFLLANGDVASGVGAVSAATCMGWGTSGSGTLTSWNFGNIGAGTNFAAFALGTINGFASAQTTAYSTSGSSTPVGLSFANIGAGSPGSFKGGIPCPADYYRTLPSSAISISGNYLVPNTNNAYKDTSVVAGIDGGIISPGNRPVIYHDGNVIISGPIVLFHGGTLTTLSSFYLVVKGGNIYIRPGVHQLDGVYIAQPDAMGNGGKIYTCSNLAGNGPPTAGQLNNSNNATGCQNQLIVKGAFIAKEIKLYRSFGKFAIGPPAEIFNFTPPTWLAAPASIGASEIGGYEAITSLSPIL